MNDQGIAKSGFKRFDRVCVIDAESNPEVLEQHSVGGLEVTLCRRCYREMTERSRSSTIAAVWTPPTDIELIGRALIEEADLLTMLAQSRWAFGHALIDRVRRDAPDDETERETK